MKNKELLRLINNIKSDIVRKTFVDEYKKMSNAQRQHMADNIETFCICLENDLNFKAKAIAAYVRMYMEDFHRKHLSDEQMKELNPIIRNAIYTFLVDEAQDNAIDISSTCRLNLAPYWEDCEYLMEH